MPVSSTFRCMFDVAKFDEFPPNKYYQSSPNPVLHKDVAVSFALVLSPNDSDYKNFLGVYLKYLDGPKPDVVLSFELFVVTDTGLVSLGKIADREISRESGYGFFRKLPRSVEALAVGGYLKSSNTMIEIQVSVTIPDDSFDNPDGDRELLTAPQRSHPDPFRVSLFNQLSTPVITNEPFCDRFELRGTDGSFFAHKSVLAFSSEVFKEWLFHPNKPPEAQSATFNNGVLKVELGKDALRHILHFIYLNETAHGFNKHALEIVETAERFRFKELKRICERSLLGRLDSMSMVSLFECLKTSETFALVQLKTAALNKLVERLNGETMLGVDDQEGFLLNLVKYAHEHGHNALKCGCDAKLAGILKFDVDATKFLAMVSTARKYELDELAKWCAKWMANNYQMFEDEGHLARLMNDQTEDGQGVIAFMMKRFSKCMLQLG